MQRKRVVLISILVIVLAIPLVTSTVDTMDVNNTQRESTDLTPIETMENIVPVDQATIADRTQYVFSWDSSTGHGDIYNFANLMGEDSDVARLVEVDIDSGIFVAFSFERTFTFETFADDYLTLQLQVRGYDYSGVTSFSHENLKFYYKDDPADSWVEVGTLSATTATSYSWDIDVPDDGQFFIKAQNILATGDAFSRNEWRLDYLRVECIDRKSYNTGVEVDAVFDDDNLYPYKGAIINDFYKVSCSIHNEEGGNLVTKVQLTTKAEDGTWLWGLEWNGNWIIEGWSEGVNLIKNECYILPSSNFMTVVFAVQLRYDCEDVSDIDFELYHESNTWSDLDLFDTTESGEDLDQEPALTFRVTPTLPSRCDPGSSPTMTGALSFAESPSDVIPHFDHTYLDVNRVFPDSGWGGGTEIDSVGNFAIDCTTKGSAGYLNTFSVHVYESESLDQYAGLVEPFVDIICDTIEVYEKGAENYTLLVDTTTTIYVKLRFSSDEVEITTGFVQWESLPMTYNHGSGRWEATPPVQNEPITIQYTTLYVITEEVVTQVASQPDLSITWARLGMNLHFNAQIASTFVTTEYDPQSFVIDVWLTDQYNDLVSGWINITMDGEEFSIFVDEVNVSTLYYSPMQAGVYTIEATYAGDHYHDSAYQLLTGLTASARPVFYDLEFPVEMSAEVTANFSLFDVFDQFYQGVYNGVTYIHDLPVDFKVKMWWTLDPEYGEPRNFVGYWNGTLGECASSWLLPWDLDGDGILTDDDFQCYVIILIDGCGIYTDVTLHETVLVNHELAISFYPPTITYSDATRITADVRPIHDHTSTEVNNIHIEVFYSIDNETWVGIDTMITNSSGTAILDWVCTESGSIFLKVASIADSRYSQAIDIIESNSEKESTILNLIKVTIFRYSDQGVLVAYLKTDDNMPLANYAVYIEIYDDDWISIGSGLTNESGIVSILWVPTLPEGEYAIQARAGLADSLYYDVPDPYTSTLRVRKENLVLSIDDTTVVEGYLTAFVFDDEGNPMEGVPVRFFQVGNDEPLAIETTDVDGCSRFDARFQGDVVMRASVEDSEYYFGVSDEMIVSFPTDQSMILVGAVVGFIGISTIAVFRKRRGNRLALPTPTKLEPKPELDKALEEERGMIPERRREEVERKIAELDGDTTDDSDA